MHTLAFDMASPSCRPKQSFSPQVCVCMHVIKIRILCASASQSPDFCLTSQSDIRNPQLLPAHGLIAIVFHGIKKKKLRFRSIPEDPE